MNTFNRALTIWNINLILAKGVKAMMQWTETQAVSLKEHLRMKTQATKKKA